MADMIKIPSFASKELSSVAKLFNNEVGKTYTLSRLSNITGLDGRTVHLKDQLQPSPRYSLSINGDRVYLSMNTPTDKDLPFDLLTYDKKDSEDGNVVFEQKEPQTAHFYFTAENSKANRAAGYDKFTKLALDLDYKIIAGLDMRANTMSERMNITVKGARAMSV